MALGNKGIELERYAFLARNQSGLLLAEAFELCNAAAEDPTLDGRGLATARRVFMEHRDTLEPINTEYGKQLIEVRNRTSTKNRRTKEEEFHHTFAAENNLYLNLCVHDWTCSEQHLDTLFFSYVAPLDELDLFPRLARYFNQAKEDFATARYLLTTALLATPRRQRISDRTTYADLLEYADYGLTSGLAKIAYSVAYNILDKIAVLLKWDLHLTESETSVDFKKVWRRKNESDLRPEINTIDDPNLFAL